jgi:cyanophycinase
MRIFLIGGGHDAATAYRPFVGAVKDGGVKDGPVVAIVRDDGADTNADRWVEGLHEAGAVDVRALVVSPDRPPTADDLDGAAGVFVAGGLTPGYREILVNKGTAWLDPVRSGLPYAGFSAGAAIAPGNALVGGYLAPVAATSRCATATSPRASTR